METLRERFKTFNYDFTRDHEKVWDKFLAFIIEYLIKQKNTTRTPTEIFISSTINKQ
jgi:hypothetical protein